MIHEAYEEAGKVLRMNRTTLGFSATIEKVDNYYSIWARDHSICSLAAIMTGDDDLIAAAKKGILYLLTRQIDHGQVPSYIEIENKKRVYGGLGQITSIDSNMWVIIAARLLYKHTRDKRFISKANIQRYKRLYRLLKAFDSNEDGLIEVHRAGDWADVFDRTYHVLYDECLYYQALKDLQTLFQSYLEEYKEASDIAKVKKRIRWISRRKPRVKRKINEYFWLTKENISKVKEDYMIFDRIEEEDYSYYLSHIMPFRIGNQKRFDTFGNLLAIGTGIANKPKKRKIISYIFNNNINKPVPLMCLYPVVRKRDKDWEPIYAFKERPYTYHNGGIWPMITGFWIYILCKNGYQKRAEKELQALAEHLKKNNYNFHEYFHGKTGKPMGRNYQAWSAAGYIIGYKSIYGNTAIFS